MLLLIQMLIIIFCNTIIDFNICINSFFYNQLHNLFRYLIIIYFFNTDDYIMHLFNEFIIYQFIV